MKIFDGMVFCREDKWIKVESVCGGVVFYNMSGRTYWIGGSLNCNIRKFERIIERGGYALKKDSFKNAQD